LNKPRLTGPAPDKFGRSRSATNAESGVWDQVLERLSPSALHLRPLWLLVLVSVLLRVLWLGRPEGALIFDESYYVDAARVLLGIPSEARYQDATLGLDPNTEHPPLAKLIVAASMALLGDNPYGWRLPSVLAGTASIILLYGIGRRLAGPGVALLAAFLLAFDNLIFVHSRIFTLDIFQLAFMLLGLYWYIHDRPALSGIGFALAALCKLSGSFGLLAVGGYEALRLLRDEHRRVTWHAMATRIVRVALSFGLMFLLLLGFMDRLWVGYSQPLTHLERILTYGTALRRAVPSGIESYPWQWLWNDVPIPYLRVEQQVMEGDEIVEVRPLVLFLGAMNPFVLGLWPFGLGLAATVWWSRRPGGELGALSLAWFLATYLPFWVMTLLGQRIAYLFYFLPTLPAVALAGSYFLLRTDLPRLVRGLYLLAVLLGFYGYFPFKPAA
jgi:dolichyl-phosphate-mannose-protein mannosyltransferase